MRKSLALQAELGPVFDVTLRLRGRRAGRRRGRARAHGGRPADVERKPLRPRRRARAPGRPRRLRRRRRDADRSKRRRAAGLPDGAQGARPRRRQAAIKAIEPPPVATACGNARAGARADRDARRAARRVRARGASAHPVAVVRADGLRLGAPRRDPGQRDERSRASSSIRWCVRAKLEIAAACHAHAKMPSHCVVTEFKQVKRDRRPRPAARRASSATRACGASTRPGPPIVEASRRPSPRSTTRSRSSVRREAARWAPIRHRDTLHDRASYRYFWQVIERARRTRQPLPAEIEQAWFGAN